MHGNTILQASPDDLRDTIGQLHALELATRRERLRAMAAYDDRSLWADDGATSMSVWLSALTGQKQQTSKEEVRVAHALEALPCIASAFAEGRLSWDHVAALTRFATPETDRQWADDAPRWTAFELEREARRREEVTRERDDADREARFLRAWWTRDERAVKLHGRLSAEDGATVMVALQRRADQQPKDPDTGELQPFERRMADALVELAGVSIANDADPDRATVVVHVSESVLTGAGPGIAELEQGVRLSQGTIRRMICDGRIEFAIQDEWGRTVGIGRCSRKVPPWLERLVVIRDGRCQFPGCDRATLLHCHHAIQWINGGPTNLNDLVAVCATHHRTVHEKGWRVIPVESGRFRFVRPDGLAVLHRRPVLRDETRQRFLGPAAPARQPAVDDTS